VQQNKTKILGIDPGMSGAIAVFEMDRLVDVLDMPVVETQAGKKKKRRISPEMLTAELEKYAPFVERAYIESVHAMPGQGVSSMFAFGEAFGLARGVMAGLKISTQLVSPASWKRGLKLAAGKDASRAMAAQLWPYAAGLFKRQRDDGRAEAALIAYWGLHHAP
jgi:crossover junction endodeoxyribonuclease RuvC